MKRILIFILIISMTLSAGCFNYKDINEVLFTTAILIDVDGKGNPILYTEVFAATRSTGQESGNEERILLKATGKSILDAARNINMGVGYKLNYTQNKAIIFTERAARYGLDNFIDFLDRDQEILLRQYLYVLSGEPQEFLNTNLKEEKFIGIFLFETVKNIVTSSKGTLLRFDEYLNKRLMGDNINVVNIVRVDKSQIEPRINIDGLAVIKDDKLVGKMTPDEGMAYNFMNNTFKQGTIEVPNPEYKDKIVTLEVLKNKTKSAMSYSGNKVYLKKTIKTTTSFAGTQKPFFLLNNQERITASKEANEYIKNICTELFNKYKEQNVDIFNIQKEFEINYPRDSVKDVMSLVQLDVEANVFIKGSSDTTDFR